MLHINVLRSLAALTLPLASAQAVESPNQCLHLSAPIAASIPASQRTCDTSRGLGVYYYHRSGDGPADTATGLVRFGQIAQASSTNVSPVSGPGDSDKAEADWRAQQEKERARLAQHATRWQEAGKGVVFDTQTGRQWTRSDNGKDLDGSRAQNYCKQLELQGKGWVLPSSDELLELYDPALAETPCGRWNCKISPLFRLSTILFWEELNNGAFPGYTNLANNKPYMDGLGILGSDGHRALCVRRP